MAVSGLCWLIKSEPEVFSIDTFAKVKRTVWDGVRNYQARNFMRDQMQVGDRVLFYQSGGAFGAEAGVVGTGRILAAAFADPTQFNPKSDYFDPKAKKDAPPWVAVELEFVAKFAKPVTLAMLKASAELSGMLVVKRGQRLSIQPVDPAHFALVEAMAKP